MRIASFIFGLISLLVCWIPCIGWLAAVPAAIGFLFGFLGCAFAPKNCDTKGLGVAGLVLSIIALVISALNFEAADYAADKLKVPANARPSSVFR